MAATTAETGSTSTMPMPSGLIPIGNSVSATGNSRPGLPKPPSKVGGTGTLAAVRSQYDPLPWTDFYDRTERINGIVPIYFAGTEGHVFVCLHGAGHSAMSFGMVALTLKATSTVVAFDWRGHGEHYCEDETNMS